MPEILALRATGFRWVFFSSDRAEPPHIHVRSGSGGVSKWWLKPTELAWSRGIPRHELTRIHRILEANRELILESWNVFFEEE